MSEWNGEDRRRSSDEKLSTILVKIAEIGSDLKHIKESFVAHIEDDKSKFQNISEELKVLTRIFWMGCGAVLVVNIIIKFM